MKKNMAKVFLGIAVIAVGVIFLGSAFGFYEMNDIRGWWTVFIIVPAVGSMLSSGVQIWNLGLTGLGVWLLIRSQGWIDKARLNYFAIAIVFVVLGLWLIFGSIRRKKKKADIESGGAGSVSVDGSPNYTAIFSGDVYKNNSLAFSGGHFTAVFGGLEIDLSDAIIQNGSIIYVTSIFGGIDVFMPDNVRLDCTDGASILGGFDNQYPDSADPNAAVVKIKYFSVFGGTDIKQKRAK